MPVCRARGFNALQKVTAEPKHIRQKGTWSVGYFQKSRSK